MATQHSLVPVINAGDGGHNHPTQTLTDLMTIHKEKGHFDNLTIGFCGDLKFGRTVHSLVAAMSRYTGIRFVFISPEELKLPRYVKEQYIKYKNIPYTQTTSLEEVIAGAGHPVHDPRPEGALLQRGGLPPPEGQLHPRPRRSWQTPRRICGSCIRCPVSTRSPWRWTTTPVPATSSRCRTASYIRMALIMKLLGIQVEERLT